MKLLICFIVTFWSGFTIYAQEAVSLYFTVVQPNDQKNLTQFPLSWQGEYTAEKDSLRKLIITEDSILVELITPVVISIQELKKDSTLQLKENLLYGIYRNKPVEVVRKNDTLIFAFVATHLFFKADPTNMLRSCGNMFLINRFNAKDRYSVTLLELNPETFSIKISYIDHEENPELYTQLKNIKRKNTSEEKLILIDFNTLQFIQFIQQGGFNVVENYIRKVE